MERTTFLVVLFIGFLSRFVFILHQNCNYQKCCILYKTRKYKRLLLLLMLSFLNYYIPYWCQCQMEFCLSRSFGSAEESWKPQHIIYLMRYGFQGHCENEKWSEASYSSILVSIPTPSSAVLSPKVALGIQVKVTFLPKVIQQVYLTWWME